MKVSTFHVWLLWHTNCHKQPLTQLPIISHNSRQLSPLHPCDDMLGSLIFCMWMIVEIRSDFEAIRKCFANSNPVNFSVSDVKEEEINILLENRDQIFEQWRVSASPVIQAESSPWVCLCQYLPNIVFSVSGRLSVFSLCMNCVSHSHNTTQHCPLVTTHYDQWKIFRSRFNLLINN